MTCMSQDLTDVYSISYLDSKDVFLPLAITYRSSVSSLSHTFCPELDDGAYNPLWTMRGFTQTFHFWKENKRAQSVPLNAFLTYVTLPWWSIVKGM